MNVEQKVMYACWAESDLHMLSGEEYMHVVLRKMYACMLRGQLYMHTCMFLYLSCFKS